jgi:hypothetical protein
MMDILKRQICFWANFLIDGLVFSDWILSKVLVTFYGLLINSRIQMRSFLVVTGSIVSDLRHRFGRATARPVVLADKLAHVPGARLALTLELAIGIVFTGL